MNQSISFKFYKILDNDGNVDPVVDEIRAGTSLSKKNIFLSTSVSEILNNVGREGDRAVIELANKFDNSNLSGSRDLFVTKREIKRAYRELKPKEILAIRRSRNQIRFLARRQMERFAKKTYNTPLGYKIEESFKPIERVGGYIPGGLASYPSTVLMISVTAKEAGVEDIIICTPAKNGRVNPSVLVAADICGVEEILKVGGVQGIGALAFGTQTVRKVSLITGPGNQYVTEAKKQIMRSGICSIDMLAGPTELLILADSSANPRLVYEDLISQAEHGNKTLCGVVSDSADLLDQVKQLASNRSERSRKKFKEISESTLFGVKANSIEKDGLAFVNKFAPEHLQVIVSKLLERRVESKLTNAGLLLFGEYAPCSASDYIVGTNHILPTGGEAAKGAGLDVGKFLKRVTIVRATKTALRKSIRDLSILAELENLPNHANAAGARFEVVDSTQSIERR